MKDIKDNLKLAFKSRLMALIMILVAIFGLIFFFSTVAGVKFFDQLIYVRYTAFGGEHLYKDAWFSRIFLASIGLIVAVVHNLIIAKIYAVCGKKVAIFFATISIFLMVVSMIVAATVLREIPN